MNDEQKTRRLIGDGLAAAEAAKCCTESAMSALLEQKLASGDLEGLDKLMGYALSYLRDCAHEGERAKELRLADGVSAVRNDATLDLRLLRHTIRVFETAQSRLTPVKETTDATG